MDVYEVKELECEWIVGGQVEFFLDEIRRFGNFLSNFYVDPV